MFYTGGIFFCGLKVIKIEIGLEKVDDYYGMYGKGLIKY